MSWTAYGSFLAFAIILVLVPGPDFAVVTRNTLAGGRPHGAWSAAGVASSNVVQGAAAAAGLGAVIVRLQPVFETIKWAGICYLCFLGVQAVRSAVRGRYAEVEGAPGRGAVVTGWRQGFLSNITNPKVLVFYLAVLPQFLSRGAPIAALILFAISHATLSLLYLLTVVGVLDRIRRLFRRRRVRRALDLATGGALLGFGARLALQDG